MASRHKFRTKGCMDEYKDKFEKDKPIKKILKELERTKLRTSSTIWNKRNL